MAGITNYEWQKEWLKDYRLNDFPALPNGQHANLGFEDYLAWLADYLYEATTAPKPEQRHLFKRLTETDPGTAMRVIGNHAGFDTVECESLPHYQYPDEFDPAVEHEPLAPLRPDEEPLGEEGYIDPVVQQDFLKRDYAHHLRYKREMEEFTTLWPKYAKTWNHTGESRGKIPEPADAGWRVLLAAILKPVTDKNQRINLLRLFFEAYADEANC